MKKNEKTARNKVKITKRQFLELPLNKSMEIKSIICLFFTLFFAAFLNAKNVEESAYTLEIWQFDNVQAQEICEIQSSQQAREKGSLILREIVKPNNEYTLDGTLSNGKFAHIVFEILFTKSGKFTDILFSQIKLERKSFYKTNEILYNNKSENVFDFHLKIGAFTPIATTFTSLIDSPQNDLKLTSVTYSIRMIQGFKKCSAPISLNVVGNAKNDDLFEEMTFSSARGQKKYNEKIYVKKEPFLSATNIVGAQISKNDKDGKRVEIKIDSAGRKNFFEVSKAAVANAKDGVRRQIAIIVDGKIVSAPYIISEINSNSFDVLMDSKEAAEKLQQSIEKSL